MIHIGQQPVSRRTFVQKLVGLVGFLVIPFHHWISDISSQQIVFRMQPVPGIRYSRAAWNHMGNRIFTSRRALVAELPYRGMIFAIEQVPVSYSREDLHGLFRGRTSLDKRRTEDRAAHNQILAAIDGEAKVLRAA
jgi:hypothetical protein